MTLRRLIQKVFCFFGSRPLRKQNRPHKIRYVGKRKPGRKNKTLKMEQLEKAPQFQLDDATHQHEPDRRGGTREGAGRKKKALEEKTEAKLLTLYPDEWEQLDKIGEELKIKRPKVIRLALKALARELEAREAEKATTP